MVTNTVYVIEDIDTIVNRMINYFQSAQSEITDFNEGSEARNLFESVGLSAYDQRFLTDYLLNMGYPHTAEGNYLDMIGILVGCKRKQAVQSKGTVVISTPTTKVDDILIADETLLTCSTDNTLFFQTVGDVTLTAGQTSVTLNVIASVGGSKGNVVAGKIDTINNPILDLDVTNPYHLADGMDTELDAPFRMRILDSGNGNITGSESWYKTEAGNIVGVHDANVVDTPLIPTHDMILYINGIIQPTPDGVITAVNDLFNQEDHKIGGISILVSKPTFVTQNLDITVTLKDGYSWSQLKPILESDLTCYFKGGTTSYGTEYVGLRNSEGIVLSVLQMIIVNSLNTKFLDYTINTPNANVDIANTEAIKLGTVTLTQGV